MRYIAAALGVLFVLMVVSGCPTKGIALNPGVKSCVSTIDSQRYWYDTEDSGTRYWAYLTLPIAMRFTDLATGSRVTLFDASEHGWVCFPSTLSAVKEENP